MTEGASSEDRRQVSVYFTVDQIIRLKTVATRRQMRVTHLVEQAVDEFLAREPDSTAGPANAGSEVAA